MSPAESPATGWKRLGEQLTRRRVELDSRYANRSLFSRERGINYRLAFDVEEAKRTNFSASAVALIASAYAVTGDSVRDVVSCGGTLKAVSAGRSREVPPRPRLAEVPPEALDDDASIERFALYVISTSGEDRPVMEAMWAAKHLPAKTRLEKMVDYRLDDPSLPVDWDKGDSGSSARRA